jgi:hypothetical protein
MLMRNIQRQSPKWRMTPPRTGPRTGPSAVGTVMTDMILPMLRPPAACMIRVAVSVIIRPPPTPWTTRKAIRAGALQAEALRIEPTRKMHSEMIHRRLPPNAAWAHPAIGIVTARASR